MLECIWVCSKYECSTQQIFKLMYDDDLVLGNVGSFEPIDGSPLSTPMLSIILNVVSAHVFVCLLVRVCVRVGVCVCVSVCA